VWLIRLFSHWFSRRTLFEIAFDVVLLIAIVLGAAWLQQIDAPRIAALMPHALIFALVAATVNKTIGFHQFDGSCKLTTVLVLASISLMLLAPVAYAIFDEIPQHDSHYAVLQVSALLALVATIAIRVAVVRLGFDLNLTRRVMVIGTGPEAQAMQHALHRDVQLVGFYPAGETVNYIPREHIVPSDVSLSEAIRRLEVDEVVIAVAERRGGSMPMDALLDCKLAGIRVLDLPSYFERWLGQVRLDSLRASWLIFEDGFRQGVLRTTVKRVFDIVVASILLMLAAPLMAMTALLILLESGRPLFYRQERIGLNGKPFTLTKFRSMRPDAESDGTPRWASSQDERVTRVGKIIRKYRIDELPQLLNVLRGDMSLVGPRPERPYFVEKLTREVPFYGARHSVKPGLTGWAQVCYQYGSSSEDAVNKLQFDLYYVKNHTLFLDLIILYRTVRVVASGKGAK